MTRFKIARPANRIRVLDDTEVTAIAGGVTARPGPGPLFPPSTGPTFPTDPEPVIINV
ncbi:MAG TPA: hypothetical protein VHC94_20010 [Nitrobacter sp.]|jgi:hypothetical protein|nr:hypothetical protein [Nitrobacter sp.]